MAYLWSLPDELLLQITSHFLLDDLQSISVTSRYLRNVCHKQLETHKELKRKYYKLDDDAQRHSTGWLAPLLALLKGEYPPSYTEVVSIVRPGWYWRELPFYEDVHITGNPRNLKPFSEDDMKLVIQAVEQSPWIPQTEPCGQRSNAKNRAHFIEEIREGDQDNILAILLPLLPNLQRLQLPAGRRHEGLGSVPGIVAQIAKVTDAALSAGQPVDDFPLSKLSFICTADSSYQHFDFGDVAPYMSLPSVREVEMMGVWQNPFEWPGELPKSRASEIYFIASNIGVSAVLGLSNGLRGPYMMENCLLSADEMLDIEDGNSELWRCCFVDERREDPRVQMGTPGALPQAGQSHFVNLDYDDFFSSDDYNIDSPDFPITRERVVRATRARAERLARLAGRNHAALLPLMELESS